MLISIHQIFAFNHWKKFLQRSDTAWQILLLSHANKSILKCTIFSSVTPYHLFYLIFNYLYKVENR